MMEWLSQFRLQKLLLEHYYVRAGDYIPADGRILECASMKVDESALTGESLGVEKTTDVIEQDEVPLETALIWYIPEAFLRMEEDLL